jgi:hypothetical protein
MLRRSQAKAILRQRSFEETSIETIYDDENMFFDEENCSEEEWLQIMKEKSVIDDLLNGKETLLGTISQVEVKQEDPTCFIAKEYDEEEGLTEEDEFVDKEHVVLHSVKVPDNVDEELKFIEKSYCDECTQTIDYDAEIKFIEKWINKPDYDEDCMVIEEEENCITDTKIESIYDENPMDIGEEDVEIEEIFMKWSLEEIKFYYELMLQKLMIKSSMVKRKQQRMVCGSSSHTNSFSKKKLKRTSMDNLK